MRTDASIDPATRTLNTSWECQLCARQNSMDSMHCTGCGNEFTEVPLNDSTKGQRIQNFSAWQQGSVRNQRISVAAAEIPSARWPYWLGGSALASSGIAVLFFLLSRLSA